MSNSTINGLTEATALSTGDSFVAWIASANATRKFKAAALDGLVFRSRPAVSSTTGKQIPLLSYAGGTPVVEQIAYETLMQEAVSIADGVITSAKLAPNIRFNPWVTKTSNYTAIAGDRIFADTSAASFTITLPAAPAVFDTVILTDSAASWDTKNLIVNPNGKKINGLAENLACDVEGEIVLRYEGDIKGWRVFAYGY